MTRVVYTGTRPPDDVAFGIELHHLPMLETVPLAIGSEVRSALGASGRRLAVFYSHNAAEHVVDALGERSFEGCEIWAVGDRTAEYLTERLRTEVGTPETKTYDGLVEALRGRDAADATIVSFELATSERRLADEGLQGTVLSVPTYETVAYNYDDLDGLLRKIGPRWVVFASPRAHEAFKANLHHRPLGDSYRVAVIGPTTRDAIVEAGDRVDFMPDEPDLAALLRKLADA